MDLIRPEAAVARMCGINCGCTRDMCVYGESGCAMVQYLEDISPVPAVPLDKLCEWLGERYEPPYSLVEIEKLKCPIDFRQQKEMWLVALTKWMEGLDAAD